MSKKYILVCVISGLLSMLALYRCFTLIEEVNLWTISYILFTLLGVIGTALSFFKVKHGHWLLILFYCLQLIQIKGEQASFDFTPVFAMHIGFVIGTDAVPVNEHIGVGVNILAVVLLVMCIRWLKIKEVTFKCLT